MAIHGNSWQLIATNSNSWQLIAICFAVHGVVEQYMVSPILYIIITILDRYIIYIIITTLDIH